MSNYKLVRAYHTVASAGNVTDSFSLPSGYRLTGAGFSYGPNNSSHLAHAKLLASASGWGSDGTAVQYTIYCEGAGSLEIYAFCVDGLTDATNTNDWIGY